MKPDTERKRYYKAKNHQKTKRMHAHLSKELRGKLKRKKRSMLIRKGDKVRIMRGPGKGKTAKVARTSHAKMKAYVEGVSVRTARGREVLLALKPSNLELVELEQTKERKVFFSEAAFKKAEKRKEPVKIEKPIVEAEVVSEKKEEPKPETKETKPATSKPEPETQDQSKTRSETDKPETGNPEPKTANRQPETVRQEENKTR